jgi:hypothetical protein
MSRLQVARRFLIQIGVSNDSVSKHARLSR